MRDLLWIRYIYNRTLVSPKQLERGCRISQQGFNLWVWQWCTVFCQPWTPERNQKPGTDERTLSDVGLKSWVTWFHNHVGLPWCSVVNVRYRYVPISSLLGAGWCRLPKNHQKSNDWLSMIIMFPSKMRQLGLPGCVISQGSRGSADSLGEWMYHLSTPWVVISIYLHNHQISSLCTGA